MGDSALLLLPLLWCGRPPKRHTPKRMPPPQQQCRRRRGVREGRMRRATERRTRHDVVVVRSLLPLVMFGCFVLETRRVSIKITKSSSSGQTATNNNSLGSGLDPRTTHAHSKASKESRCIRRWWTVPAASTSSRAAGGDSRLTVRSLPAPTPPVPPPRHIFSLSRRCHRGHYRAGRYARLTCHSRPSRL